MQDITQTIIKKKIDYDKMFKTCGYLLEYLSDPEQTVKNVIKSLEANTGKDNDDKIFLASLKEIDTGLVSVFTKEHAVSKGRGLFTDTIKKYEKDVERDRIAIRDSIKILSDSIKNDLNLIYTTIELNNPLRNMKMITEGKEMIRNYFESRLSEFNKSEVVAGFGDQLTKLTATDIFAILPNILAKGIEIYSAELQQKVDNFKKSTKLVHELYVGKCSDPESVYNDKFPSGIFSYPRIPFIKFVANETKEYKTYNSISESFYNLIMHLVTLKGILGDKTKILTDYLDELSTCNSDTDDKVLNHLLYEGIYKYEKPVITLEEVTSICKYDSKYLEVFHTINSRHINGLFRSGMCLKALLSLYAELSNYVYKALDKVV